MTAATNPASAFPIDGQATPPAPAGTVAAQNWPAVAVTITPLPTPLSSETTPISSVTESISETASDVPSAPEPTPLAPSTTWYVVSRGITPGIYSSWLAAAPQVTGVSGCIFSKYPTEALARAAWAAAQNAGTPAQVGV